MRLETLVLELMADSSQLNQSVDNAINKAAQKIKSLEGKSINIKAPIKDLLALDAELIQKQKDIKETARVANSTPIVVRVDGSQVKSARKELKGLRDDLGMSGGSQTINVKVEHQYKVDVRESNRDIAHQIKDLGSGLRDIVAAVKSTKQGIVGKAVGGLIGAAVNTPLAIARGALEGIGRSVSSDIGKSFSLELESQLSGIVGSFDFLGKRMGEKTKKVTDAVSVFMDKTFHDVVKAQAIAEGGNLAKKATAAGKPVSDSQMEKFMQSYMDKHYYAVKKKMKGGLSSQELEDESLIVADKKGKKNKARKKAIEDGRIASFKESAKAVEDLDEKYQSILADFKKNAPSKKSRLTEISPDVDKYQKQLGKNQKTLSRNLLAGEELKQELSGKDITDDRKSVVIEKLKLIEITRSKIVGERKALLKESEVVFREYNAINGYLKAITQAMDETGSALGKANSLHTKIGKGLLPKLSVKENTASILKMLTGKDIDPAKMPEVEQANLQGSHGKYSATTNRVKLSPELYKIVANNSIESIISNPEYLQALATLSHELAHSVDFDFGSQKGMLAAARKKVVVNPQKVSLREATSTSSFYTQSPLDLISQYKPAHQRLELNAEIQARRLLEQKTGVKSESKIDLLASAHDIGVGTLDNIKTDIRSVEGDLLKDFEEKVHILDALKKSVAVRIEELINQSAQNIDDLSPDDINGFLKGVSESVSETIKINNKINKVHGEVSARIKAVATYKKESANIESLLDKSFNENDSKSLRTAKNKIAEQLKAIKNDGSLDDKSKAVLTNQLVDAQKKARVDTKYRENPTAKELLLSPIDSIKLVAEKAGIELYDAGENLVHRLAEGVKDATHRILSAASDPAKLLSDAGQGGLAIANKAARGVAPTVAGGYGVMRGAEKALFSFSQAGPVNILEVVKAVMQVSGGASLMHSAPIVGELFQAIGGGAGHMAGSAVNVEMAGHLLQQTPQLAEGAGLFAQAGHMADVAKIAGSNAASMPVIQGVTQMTTAVSSAAIEFLAEVVALLTTGKVTLDQAKKLLEAKTVDEFKAIAPSIDGISNQVQKSTTKKLKGIVEKAKNLDKYLPTLPESQRDVIGQYLPIAAEMQDANKGKFNPANVGLKALAPSDFNKLDPKTKESVKDDLITQYKIAQNLLNDFKKKVAQTVPLAERTMGEIGSVASALKRGVTNLEKQAQKLGVDIKPFKVEESNFKGVTLDVASAMPDLKNAMPNFSSVGKNMGEGANEGLLSVIPEAQKVAVEFAEKGFNEPFKTIQEIKSPSKLWKKFTKWMGMGSVLGIKESIPDVKKATEEMAKAAIPKYKQIPDPWGLPTAKKIPPNPYLLKGKGSYPDPFMPSIPVPAEYLQAIKEAEEKANHLAKQKANPKPLYDEIANNPIPENFKESGQLLHDLRIEAEAPFNTQGIEDYNTILERINENAHKALTALNQMGEFNSPDAESLKEIALLTDPSKKVSHDVIQSLNPESKFKLQLTGNDAHDAIINKAMSHANKANEAMSDIDNPPPPTFFNKLREQFPIVDQGIEKLKSLKSTIITLGAAGVGAIGLVLIGKQLANVAIESVKVYRNFESIFIASKLVAGGEKYIQSMQKQVLQLGGDLESTLRQGVGFASAAIGTPLENVSQQMFLDSSKSLQLLGIQGQQYDSALLALKQVASKGRVSLEEISGQLGESVPGILPMVAAALNTNVQGAIQMIESGNVLSEELLPKLTQQMKIRTQGLEAIYEKSLTAATGRVSAGTETLQLELGKNLTTIILPAINLVGNAIIGVVENIDKAVLVAKLFASTLIGVTAINAFPFLVSGAGMLLNTLKALITSTATWKAVGLGALNTIKAGLVGLAGVFVFEAISASSSKGSTDVVAANEAVANSYKKIKVNAEEARLEEEKRKREEQNPLLRAFDDFIENRPALGIGTFREAERLKNVDTTQNTLNMGQEILNQSNQVEDPALLNAYLAQADKIEKLRQEKQGRSQALRIEDAQKFAKEIAKLDNEVNGKGGLFEQRANLDESFLQGGKGGLEGRLSALKEAQKTMTNVAEKDEAGRMIATLERRVNILAIAEERLSNGINKQRLAWIALNGEIARSNELLQSQNIDAKTAILKEQSSGKIGENLAAKKQANLEVLAQQNTVKALIEQQRKTEQYIETQLQTNPLSTVRTLLKKGLMSSDAGDIKELELKIANDSKLKAAVGEQVLQPLQEYQGRKLEIKNALQALEQANVSLLQNTYQQVDALLNYNRSLEDWNLDMKRQAIDAAQQIESYRREVEDAGIQFSRENRDLAESFSDLMFDLQTQLKTAKNEFIDIQDKIKSTKLKREILEISSSDNSLPQKLATIFANLSEKLASGESESRKLEMEQSQVGREYVNTLRKIRGEQEKQFDAEKNRTRAIADLAIKTVQLSMNLSKIIIDLQRQVQDKNRQNERENKGQPSYSPNVYQVPKQLSTPQQLPTPPQPKVLKPITSPQSLLPMGGVSDMGGGILNGSQPQLTASLVGDAIQGGKAWFSDRKSQFENVRKQLFVDRKKWSLEDWSRNYLQDVVKIEGDLQEQIEEVTNGPSSYHKGMEKWIKAQKDASNAIKGKISQFRKEYESNYGKSSNNTQSQKPATASPFVMPKVEEHRLPLGKLIQANKAADIRKGEAKNWLRMTAKKNNIDDSYITQSAIDLVNSGQLGKTAKISLFPNAKQQDFEAYLRLPVSERQKIINAIYAPKKQIKSVVTPQQTKQPSVATKSVIAKPIPIKQSIQSQLGQGINNTYPQIIPSNFGQLSGLPESIRDQQLLNIEAKKVLTTEQKALNFAEFKKEAESLWTETHKGIQQTQRSIDDSSISTIQLIQNSKGYLTVQEQIAKVGSDINAQYISSIRTLNDQAVSLASEIDGREKAEKAILGDINAQVAAGQITKEQGNELLAINLQNLDISLQDKANQLTEINGQKLLLENERLIAKAKGEQLDTEKKRIEEFKTMADLQSNLANAQYNQGGSLINRSGIIKAKSEVATAEFDARERAKTMFFDAAKTEEFVKNSKELANINLAQAYTDAIPGLNQFTEALGGVIKGTTTWRDGLKSVLDAIADVVLQTLVLNPIKNSVGSFLGQMFGNFAQGTDYYVPNYAGGIDSAMTKERAMSGKTPYLAVLHQGESVLSTLNGDAQMWQSLKANGEWDNLKATVPNYAQGNTNITPTRSQSSGGVTIVQNHTYYTPDADSFRKSQSRIDNESAARLRRTTSR